MTMMTMTHTEKQFLYDIGEEEWTDTWFDIIPEEVWQIIYRHLNAKTIKRLSDPFCEKHQDMILGDGRRKVIGPYQQEWIEGQLQFIYMGMKLDYDKQEIINFIEKIPICGNELKKIRDNPPKKFMSDPREKVEKMDYLELPPGCEKLPMKYITKSGQVYVFVSAIQTNRGANIDAGGKVSITIEINYRELNGVKLGFIKKLEHREMSKNKVSTLTWRRLWNWERNSSPLMSGLELRDSMEYLNHLHRSTHALNLERWEILRPTLAIPVPVHTPKKIKLYKKKSGCLL